MMKAFRNKKFSKNNAWIGTMTDGVTVKFQIRNGIIETAYPFF